MKLKLVVTTMIVAGAVSASAFADDGMQAQLDAMKAQVAQMQMAMNANNAGINMPNTGWFNRISVSGLANVDAMGTTHYSPVNFTTNYPSALAVSSAAVFADANVSDWTKAHVGMAYGTGNQLYFNYLRPGAYTSSDATGTDAHAYLDEAYATIGDFAKSPFYLKAGKQYLPFGSYTPFKDITPSLTQVLSQVNDPAAVVGFVANNGINGALYGLQGLEEINTATSHGVTTRQNNGKSAIRNWGAQLGIQNAFNNLGYTVGVGYLYNMADVTGIEYALTNTNSTNTTNGVSGYVQHVGAFAANAGLKYSAFDVDAKYVTAVQTFSQYDITYNGSGAKPSAWGADLGYSFPILKHDTRFSLGYQGSAQSANMNMFGNGSSTTAASGGLSDFDGMGLPRSRYLADYTVNVSKFTDLGFEVRRDNDYSSGDGGTGNNTTTGVARLAVKFA